VSRRLPALAEQALPGRPDQPRRGEDEGDETDEKQRNHHDDPRRDDEANPWLQLRDAGVTPAGRPEGREDRPDAREEIRHAGRVGQDVVAVEADQRRQLANHLKDLGRDDQEQRVPAAEPPDRGDAHGDDGVEVQAAEVGTDSSRSAEAIRIGHVGVKRRPQEVPAGAHRAGLRPASSRGRRVPELVEAGREDRDDDDEREELRPGKGVVCRRGEAAVHQQPPHDPPEDDEDRQPDPPVEQGGEWLGDSTCDHGVSDGELEAESSEWVGPRHLGRRAVGLEQQAERPELLVDERFDVRRRNRAPRPLRDDLGDLRVAAAAVDRLQHRVEE
jgi:hypothetical protein